MKNLRPGGMPSGPLDGCLKFNVNILNCQIAICLANTSNCKEITLVADLVGGIPTPLKTYESQLGQLFSIYGKRMKKKTFSTPPISHQFPMRPASEVTPPVLGNYKPWDEIGTKSNSRCTSRNGKVSRARHCRRNECGMQRNIKRRSA